MTISDRVEREVDKRSTNAFDYPRPRFVRDLWKTLDGAWSFSASQVRTREEVNWQGTIQVPYPPEAALSGVDDQAFHPVVWYRRSFEIPGDWRGKQIILHFGAVDYKAQVWVNGQLVMSHEGGHTPFSADITHVLGEGEQEVVVKAEDDPLEMSKPRGKQDWQKEPHRIWYPRTTGIWQSVWLEPVAAVHLSSARFTPDLANFAVLSEVEVAGDISDASELSLELSFTLGDEILAVDRWQLTSSAIARTVHLGVSGFDDLRRFIWSPEHPNLIDITLKLYRGETLLDEVESYTGLRSVEARDGKVFLNNHPYFLRLALDQGYWDESLLAAPSGEALKKDVELAKAMGFNGVRKHQKIEDPRYLYWADRLGLLVWEELPSAYAFTSQSVNRLTKEWLEVIERDYSHPSVMAWVCYNESWGVPNLPHSAAQRHAVRALYHLTKTLDPHRLVVGNDGWEHTVSDLLTIHDYSADPEALAARYATPERGRHTSTQTLEHGRATLLPDASPEMRSEAKPIILSEFGGVRYNADAEGWGYQQVESEEALLTLYADMVRATSGLAGFCYTQFADTFQEQNGLLYSDRRPKVALERLSKATRNQVEERK